MADLTLTVERVSDLPADVLWSVVADLDGYADHVGTLTTTTVVAGAAEGARRRCVDARGRSWEETCVLWDDGRRYVIDVDVATYPLDLRMLFRSFRGTWEVEPRVDGGSVVRVQFEGDVRGGRPATTVVARMAARARRDLEATLASYERVARSTLTR
jgi:hypothetical protein